MSTTNRERATRAFDILTAGLRPFVVQQMRGRRGTARGRTRSRSTTRPSAPSRKTSMPWRC